MVREDSTEGKSGITGSLGDNATFKGQRMS